MDKRQLYPMTEKTYTNGFLGAIIPCFIKETVPNGKYSISPQVRIDFSPFADRFYGSMEVRLRYFRCSFNYLWEDWDDLKINGQTHQHPYITIDTTMTVNDDDVMSYFPFSDKLIADITQTPATVSALPPRMYRSIVRNFYRSSFGNASMLQEDFVKTSGADNTTPTFLEYDEFEPDLTSQLQYISLPISTPAVASAPFTYETLKTMVQTTRLHDLWRALTSRRPGEFYRLVFGKSKDLIDYPENLKNYSANVYVNEIVSTADTATAGLGKSAGLAFSTLNGEPFTVETDTFGFIMGCISIMPENHHVHGMHPCMELKSLPEDYLTPYLAGVGLTPGALRYNIEYRKTAQDDDVLGYATIYDRYRKPLHYVAGQMCRDYDYQVLKRHDEPDNQNWGVGSLACPEAGEYDYLFDTDEPHYRVQIKHVERVEIPLPLVIPGNMKLDSPEV